MTTTASVTDRCASLWCRLCCRLLMSLSLPLSLLLSLLSLVVSGEDPVTLNEGDIVVGNWKSYHTLFKEGLIDLL